MLLLFFVLAVSPLFGRTARAQNQELQQYIAEIKQAAAKNQQALAQYTWVERVNISLKGEQKKQEHFQVRLGPDGKPQKTSLDPAAAPPPDDGGRKHRLKDHVVEKKKEQYKEYAEQMKALAQQYVPPDKGQLQQASEPVSTCLAQRPGRRSGQHCEDDDEISEIRTGQIPKRAAG
jgi:hypothetical protein